MHIISLLASLTVLTAVAAVKGDLTHFTPDTGACGKPNYPWEDIVAISDTLYDEHDGNLCGRTICIERRDGSVVKAVIEDRCIGCAKLDIDIFGSRSSSTSKTTEHPMPTSSAPPPRKTILKTTRMPLSTSLSPLPKPTTTVTTFQPSLTSSHTFITSTPSDIHLQPLQRRGCFANP
ncbi:hypothetical protein BASA61_006068 [Batrachochytrium salamandrivorans]|nr:hypothetical protein BASA62_003364 [Batrachochytrium salamandrivorans]KAH6588163.1 hypothetical protein BASA61_006068 [Batrachochytrium salamandrivorans]